MALLPPRLSVVLRFSACFIYQSFPNLENALSFWALARQHQRLGDFHITNVCPHSSGSLIPRSTWGWIPLRHFSYYHFTRPIASFPQHIEMLIWSCYEYTNKFSYHLLMLSGLPSFKHNTDWIKVESKKLILLNHLCKDSTYR